MKKLEKKFTANYDKVGNNIFTQVKRTDDVALYHRTYMDGTHKSYEVFIVKKRFKGEPLPGGLTEKEDRECYPGSSSFGRYAYDCKNESQAEDRYDELLVKAKNQKESKEESKLTGKPNKGRRSTKKIAISTPKGKFTMKMLVTQTGLTQPQIYPVVKQWLTEGIIKVVETIKSEGKGRSANVYQLI